MNKLEPEITRSRVPALLLIVAAAALFCFRLLIAGVPPNGDARDHAVYQFNFSRQFWSGDLYPRWLAEADKGYGSPIFLAQYPFPYFVTAVLRPVLSFPPTDTREARELGIFCFLMLAGAGLASYYWFRYRCSPMASVISAIAYMLLPYLAEVVLYNRVAIGELATFVWMPLLLGLADRAKTKRLAILSAIAVAFALLLMSNILTAILFVPVLLLYAAASGRRTTLSVLFALVFGICLAAVYILPAFLYQGLFTPKETIVHRPLAQLGRNFLYVSLSELHSRRTAIPVIVIVVCLLSFIAYRIATSAAGLAARVGMLLTVGLGLGLLIPDLGPKLITLSGLKVSGFDSYSYYAMDILFTDLLTLGLGVLAYCRLSGRRTHAQERVLLVVVCCAFVLMLPWAAIIWKIAPYTDIVQYPWRLSSILTVAVAGLFAAGIDSCLRRDSRSSRGPSLRAMACVAIITIGAGGIIWRIDRVYRNLSAPRVDITRCMDPMYFAFIPPSKIYQFARRVGTSPDAVYVKSTPVQPGVSAVYTAGKGRVSVKRITPEKLFVAAECQGNSQVQIGQLCFPLWKIAPVKGFSVDGETLGSSADDLMEVSLTPGRHEFWLVFDTGVPERVAGFLSLASVLLMVAGLAFVTLRRRKPGIPDEGLSPVEAMVGRREV
jgi:hypothetical protein